MSAAKCEQPQQSVICLQQNRLARAAARKRDFGTPDAEECE